MDTNVLGKPQILAIFLKLLRAPQRVSTSYLFFYYYTLTDMYLPVKIVLPFLNRHQLFSLNLVCSNLPWG